MLQALLQHDRAAVLGCLVVVILLAWGYLFLGAGIEMDTMDMGGGQSMVMAPPWTVAYGALIFIMWAIMMVAMMLPSVAPTVLLVAALARGRSSLPSAGLFALGYVLVWIGSAWSQHCYNGVLIAPECCRKQWPPVAPLWPASC